MCVCVGGGGGGVATERLRIIKACTVCVMCGSAQRKQEIHNMPVKCKVISPVYSV